MRLVDLRSLVIVSMVMLPAGLGILALPSAVSAVGGVCGGSILCDCGDQVVASRTLVPGVDPITTKVCPGPGLFFFNDGVTLNLGGATIRGSGEGNISLPERGIEINKSAHVTVMSGSIRGFDIGIEGNGAIAALVSNVQVTGSKLQGIFFTLIGENVIEKCVVRNNLGHGIEVQGDDNSVRFCRVESNGGTGLSAFGNDNVVARNVVNRNGGDGIDIGGARALVDRNQSKYNAKEGITVEGTDHTLFNNVVASNGENGFTVSATNSRFDRNRSESNGGFGIADSTSGDGTGGTGNTYVNNRCTGNADGDSSPPDLCS